MRETANITLADINRLIEENERKDAEIERLTAWALEERSKVERLAAALRNIIAGNDGECGCAESARAALEIRDGV